MHAISWQVSGAVTNAELPLTRSSCSVSAVITAWCSGGGRRVLAEKRNIWTRNAEFLFGREQAEK